MTGVSMEKYKQDNKKGIQRAKSLRRTIYDETIGCSL